MPTIVLRPRLACPLGFGPAVASAVSLLFVCLLIAWPSERAKAASVVAPVGGKPLLVPAGQVACGFDGDSQGWRIGLGSRHLVPPLQPGQATAQVADTVAGCANDTEPLLAVAFAALPNAPPEDWTVFVDAGRVEVIGSGLAGSALVWQVGDANGADHCREPTGLGNGQERCAFAVPDVWPAEPSAINLAVLPHGVSLAPDRTLFDARGRKVALPSLLHHPARIVVRDLLPDEAGLDAESEEARVSLRHREAVAQVACVEALCEWNGRELLVRAMRGDGDALEAHVGLKPHIYVASKNAVSQQASLSIPLQRCPLALASVPLWRGVGGQKVVLRVGGHCAQDESLKFFVNGVAANAVDRQTIGKDQFTVVHLDTSLGDECAISLQRRSRVVALLRHKTRQLPNLRARIELPNHGAIDFLPTNRDADLLLPALPDGGTVVAQPVAGVYAVNEERPGLAKVRGVKGATGWVTLRFAVRDSNLPGDLASLNLLQYAETVERNLHPASLPVMLGSSELSQSPIVELLCADASKIERRMAPAKPANLPYSARDSCRLVLHRERLKQEEGDQLFRITVSVAGLDGTNRPEAGLDQRIKLSPGPEPRVLYISGAQAPFDRVVVRATVITEDLPEAVLAERFNETLRLPQVQWTLVMGDSRLRLFATTAMPTGLFRVADNAHSGLMGLSAGVLMRLVYLMRSGHQMPVGIEAGALLVGIVGDTTPAPHGQTAAVFGLSLSVPIANVSRSTQAAINLHAWAEYEVSRRFIANAGSPWGFIFGPSLSFGDVGWNL